MHRFLRKLCNEGSKWDPRYALDESMVKCTEKVAEKNQVKKEIVFHENTKKYNQILLKFHFETIEPSIGFIVNQL